jgi:DNA-binding NarL/FixJ family response regulator
MITIVLADDHHVVRQGLRALLESEPDFRIVGEASDGLETVRLIDRLRPRILIVDLVMPGLDGLEITRQVTRHTRETRVVVLSMHAGEPYVLKALRNGALGYVLKDSTAGELVAAIREVAAGRRYLSRPLSSHVLDVYARRAQETPPDDYDRLTTREREVLHLVAEGHTSAGAAARLGISPRTVESHRASLMQKLDLRTQADLIRFVLQRGLVPMRGSERPGRDRGDEGENT